MLNSDTLNSLTTPRLRLVPIGPKNADDLWLVHDDEAVIPWYDGWQPSRDEAAEYACRIAESWRLHGVHKWIAYDKRTGDVVGRGGLSRTPINDDWSQIYRFLPNASWVETAYKCSDPYMAHAHWLEIGWALLREHWGQGYASEIATAGLDYAFDTLDVQAVVSCTVRHNLRSKAVMERNGLRYAGEIRSRGTVEGEDHVRDDAPFSTYVILQEDRETSCF